MRLSTKVHLALGGLVASTLIVATPALAAPGRGGPGPSDQSASASGSCSAQATWKLKAKDDDGRIQAEFEVDGIASNRTWHVTLADNGTVFFAGNRHRTDAGQASPSGPELTTRPDATGLRPRPPTPSPVRAAGDRFPCRT